VTGLLALLSAVEGTPVADLETRFAGSGYGDFKGAVADAVVDLLEPIQARHAEISADPGEVERILAAGAERARAIAVPVLEDVRAAIGFAPRA
jgi:tryptophanyl-tRNA synthetase